MKDITFIHAADLHLDSPFLGLNNLPKAIFKRIQESTFTSFVRIIDAAISSKVDFVLICGDLYDGEDRSIKAQARLRKQFERLYEHNIAVFLLHGNHDHLEGSWTNIQMPDNVHIFPSDVKALEYTTKSNEKVHIYGFSYPKRHVIEKKIDEYVKMDGADFHIGMIHGQVEGGSEVHQPYSPFSIRDLLGKQMDYWALGHIHKQQILNEDPYIIYPGNIQGRNRKEEDHKGCFSVSLTETETTIQFIETADILWETLTISTENLTTFSDIFTKCKKEIENIRKVNQGILLNIEIINNDQIDTEVYEKLRNNEFIETLQDGEELEDAFVWTYRLTIIETNHNDDMINDPIFHSELRNTVGKLEERDMFEKAIHDLYTHPYASRYLEKLTDEEKNDVLLEAERLVANMIKVSS